MKPIQSFYCHADSTKKLEALREWPITSGGPGMLMPAISLAGSIWICGKKPATIRSRFSTV
jgi:hypothetical protein